MPDTTPRTPSTRPSGREMAGVMHLDLLEYAKERDDEVEAVHAESDGDETSQNELVAARHAVFRVPL